jgi:hypothetical protein
MKKLLLLFALVWLCGVPECRALKSESLVSYCQVAKKTVMTDAEMIQFQFCNGYIQGISDAMQMQQAEIDAKGRLIHKQTYCLPDEVTTTELALVYLKYMDGHPEKLHEDSFVTLWNALNDAYRCPRSAPHL